jgi:hypothetical protein
MRLRGLRLRSDLTPRTHPLPRRAGQALEALLPVDESADRRQRPWRQQSVERAARGSPALPLRRPARSQAPEAARRRRLLEPRPRHARWWIAPAPDTRHELLPADRRRQRDDAERALGRSPDAMRAPGSAGASPEESLAHAPGDRGDAALGHPGHAVPAHGDPGHEDRGPGHPGWRSERRLRGR